VRPREGGPLWDFNGGSFWDFIVGATSAASIGAVALRANALDRGGALAAFAVGTATYGGLGLRGAAVLLAFFVPSIALSRFGRERKRAALADVDKTGARDAAQVLANGGVAAACALCAHFVGPRFGGTHPSGTRFSRARLRESRFAVAFAGAFAAAAADTWGTEIGTLIKQPPRSIVTLKPIATGLSGGVSAAGTLAEIAGAFFVAVAAVALVPRAFWAVFAGGVAGALLDSVLGASVQALAWCPACLRATERNPHGCGSATQPLRGLSWLGNDAVNLAATAGGAFVAVLLARDQRRPSS
jgi:uncharacterized protein (TIGR00297 family)